MAEIFDFKKFINEEEIKKAAKYIKESGIVIFPTETVYGIGANGLDEEAVNKIFLAKGRAADNPLILHISNIKMLDELVNNINDIEQKLMEAFWPGPLTIILPKKDIVPYNTTAGLDTVAIRMPKNKVALKLIEEANLPIAAPSANVSGRPSGTNITDILDELKDKVDVIIDGGNTDIGLESTVVRVIDNIPTILRPGKITPEDIKAVVGCVKLDKNLYSEPNKNEHVLSPGMKHRHYAPKSNCVLICSDENKNIVNQINKMILDNTGKKIVVLSSTENVDSYNADVVLNLGSNLKYEEISKSIFTILRKVDNYKADLVLIEGVKKEGLGIAIMNRLIRACGYNVVEC